MKVGLQVQMCVSLESKLVLQQAVKAKKAKDFGVKLIESKAKTISNPLAPASNLRKPVNIPPSKVPE
jgi:hypothetical protein